MPLTCTAPLLLGHACTASLPLQGSDVFFQAAEAANPYFDACPAHVVEAMAEVTRLTGRQYGLFEYMGHPEAERVVVLMGSGCEVAQEAVEYLVQRGYKVGVIKVRCGALCWEQGQGGCVGVDGQWL